MRFHKQVLLPFIGEEGQKKIQKGRVCIVGCGALGGRCAELLVRAGLGFLCLIDGDFIEESNLQRQTLFSEEDLGKKKVEVLQRELKMIYSKLEIDVKDMFLRNEDLSRLDSYDVVLDCTDDLSIAFLLDSYCQEKNIPLVFGSVAGVYGLLLVSYEDVSFEDVFHTHKDLIRTCEKEGILNSAVSALSSMLVTEVLKILSGNDFCKELLFYNAWTHSLKKISLSKRL